MKILHCADIHLDSPMETHMTREQAATRNIEILKSFQRMTEYAASEKIELVLIAGDFFDGERVTRRTVDGIFDAVTSTPQIDYLYLSGNHDNWTNAFVDYDIPTNFKCFKDSWNKFTYGDISVSGIEMTKANAEILYEQLPKQDNLINIVMLHGQTSTSSGIDRVNLNLLKDKNIQYLALGHIHTYSCNQLDRDGIYCYPGCLEGRGFDECGKKGFVVLDTDARKIEPTFVPFSLRELHHIEVDITGYLNNTEIYNAMKKETQDISKNDMVEFILTGSRDIASDLSIKYLYQLADTDFFFVKIKDNTKVELDPKEFENDISLKGEFIRLVMASNSCKEDKIQIIRAGLEALSGEKITV
ncbi:MAG: metallophosphoesterase [Lachnoanaerobaculum gingivalis]